MHMWKSLEPEVQLLARLFVLVFDPIRTPETLNYRSEVHEASVQSDKPQKHTRDSCLQREPERTEHKNPTTGSLCFREED